MKTRRLIVAALVCALAILVAGVVQLLRISGADEPEVDLLSQGESATVGGVTVGVTGSTLSADALAVEARFAPASPDAEVPVTSFTLLVGGRLEGPTNSASTEAPGCARVVVVGAAGVTCVVTFPHHDGTATVAFSRGGEQQLWRLDPTGGG